MNIYKALNEITEYIDNHLEEKIDYEILARMLGVNSYTMQRIFSLLTNISLSDYIRKRRLSVSGEDLYNNPSLKVMDIAIKYCYDNATSFSRAFEQFHGIKPSQITKENKLKIFPRIIFEEKNEIKEPISYEIVELDELILYGTYIKTDNDHIEYDAPRFFAEIEKKNINKYGEITYGMVTYEERVEECHEKTNAYWVLYNKEIPELERVVIPKSKWLLFRINSQEAKDIRDMSQQFYLEFLPSCKYNLSPLPELEYYHDDITDFLVPIN